MTRLRGSAILLLLLVCGAASYGANIHVPLLELITRAVLSEGVLSLTTRGNIDMAIGGGYKFGGQIGLSYQGTELEKGTAATSAGEDEVKALIFKSAGVTISDILSLPLSFSYFVGESDGFCSGDIFTALYGSAPIATKYRGFVYFPSGPEYEGMHVVTGTGLKVDVRLAQDALLLSTYAYQDSNISATEDISGHYSVDLKALLNTEKLKLEAFVGVTYPISTYGYYRGGVLFYAADEGVEFLTQLGIPKWDPAAGNFGIELFYLLFEPRLHLGIFSIIPTFFWQPKYYLNKDEGMSGSFDVNLNMRLGNIQESPISAGIEANLAFRREGAQQITVKGSPYASFVTPGIVWDIKIDVKAWPFSLANLLEGYIRIEAAF